MHRRAFLQSLAAFGAIALVVPTHALPPQASSQVTVDPLRRALATDTQDSAYILAADGWDSFEILTNAVLRDAGGEVIYNLPQQDMIAIKVTDSHFRVVGKSGPLEVVVPIPTELIDDAGYNLWEGIKPAINEARALVVADAEAQFLGYRSSWDRRRTERGAA